MTKRSIISKEINKLDTLLKLSTLDGQIDRCPDQFVGTFDNIYIYYVKSLLNALDQANDCNPDEPQLSIIQKLGSKNEPNINGFFKYGR